jgi:hypothetical protein
LEGPDDCEFDYDGFCFWKNDKNSLYTFDWLRWTGATPSKNTGPTADHTSGKGKIMTSGKGKVMTNGKGKVMTPPFCFLWVLPLYDIL